MGSDRELPRYSLPGIISFAARSKISFQIYLIINFLLIQDSPWVALVKTKVGNLSRLVEIKPTCLIKGFVGEVPNCINFYQKCKEGSNVVCLTIAWSSGRVQHFPIVEKEPVPPLNASTSLLSHSYSVRHDTYNFNLSASYC